MWILQVLMFLTRPYVLIGSAPSRCCCGCPATAHSSGGWCDCGCCSYFEQLSDYWLSFDPSDPPLVTPPAERYWGAA